MKQDSPNTGKSSGFVYVLRTSPTYRCFIGFGVLTFVLLGLVWQATPHTTAWVALVIMTCVSCVATFAAGLLVMWRGR